jgi:hypothetical protein
MGCKRARPAPALEIEKATIREGFGGPLGDGLPCGFRKRITMDAMGRTERRHTRPTKAAVSADNTVWEIETPGTTCSRRERGRRRTRQDQIPPKKKSPVKLQTSSDPHRTKKTCFFCRTGFDRRERLSKVRSSRLT